MSEDDLSRMSREELEELMEKIMFRLHQLDVKDLQREIVTRSQKVRLESAKTN